MLTNLKSLDWVGHKYGPDSPEISATLEAMDKAVADILSALDRKVGPDKYVVAITADHGMPPEPATGESGRITEPDIAKLIHDRFDTAGRLVRVYESANGQLYLDRDRLVALGVTLDQIAQYPRKPEIHLCSVHGRRGQAGEDREPQDSESASSRP